MTVTRGSRLAAAAMLVLSFGIWLAPQRAHASSGVWTSEPGYYAATWTGPNTCTTLKPNRYYILVYEAPDGGINADPTYNPPAFPWAYTVGYEVVKYTLKSGKCAFVESDSVEPAVPSQTAYWISPDMTSAKLVGQSKFGAINVTWGSARSGSLSPYYASDTAPVDIWGYAEIWNPAAASGSVGTLNFSVSNTSALAGIGFGGGGGVYSG